MTISCGLRTGSVLISTLFNRLKMAVLAPMPSASESDGDRREPGVGAKNADGVTEILSNHVTMLPEGGGDEVDAARGPRSRRWQRSARRRLRLARAGRRRRRASPAVLAAELRRDSTTAARDRHRRRACALQLARDQAGRRGPGVSMSVTRRASASATARPSA